MEVLVFIAELLGGSVSSLSTAAEQVLPFAVIWAVFRMERILKELVKMDKRILKIETIIEVMTGKNDGSPWPS